MTELRKVDHCNKLKLARIRKYFFILRWDKKVTMSTDPNLCVTVAYTDE